MSEGRVIFVLVLIDMIWLHIMIMINNISLLKLITTEADKWLKYDHQFFPQKGSGLGDKGFVIGSVPINDKVSVVVERTVMNSFVLKWVGQ